MLRPIHPSTWRWRRIQILSPTHRETNQFLLLQHSKWSKIVLWLCHFDRDASRFYETSLRAALGTIFNRSLFMAIQRSKRNSQGTQRLNECKGLGTCTAPVSLSSQAHTDCHDEPNSFFDVRHGESFTSRIRATSRSGIASSLGLARSYYSSSSGPPVL
jgi:hypothetical protein